MRIICVNTGEKYSQWYTDNLKYMIDKYSCLKYKSFEIINWEIYGGVFDKLQMFDRFRDGQNIYFDLDVLIKGDCNKFISKDLTVCHAWWRDAWHTPLNSSIISWNGDISYIHDQFVSDLDYHLLKYQLGIDQYLYEAFNPNTYTNSFCSFQTIKDEENYDVYLFNQTHEYMKTTHWCQKYLLQS
tara:strand:+ start:265 stop:819 length:555 start_codon:yes stop_codon:yes gene_type:complete